MYFLVIFSLLSVGRLAKSFICFGFAQCRCHRLCSAMCVCFGLIVFKGSDHSAWWYRFATNGSFRVPAIFIKFSSFANELSWDFPGKPVGLPRSIKYPIKTSVWWWKTQWEPSSPQENHNVSMFYLQRAFLIENSTGLVGNSFWDFAHYFRIEFKTSGCGDSFSIWIYLECHKTWSTVASPPKINQAAASIILSISNLKSTCLFSVCLEDLSKCCGWKPEKKCIPKNQNEIKRKKKKKKLN